MDAYYFCGYFREVPSISFKLTFPTISLIYARKLERTVNFYTSRQSSLIKKV